jgi:hypothetical protein
VSLYLAKEKLRFIVVDHAEMGQGRRSKEPA